MWSVFSLYNVTFMIIKLLLFFLVNKNILTIEIFKKLYQKCFSNVSYTVMTKLIVYVGKYFLFLKQIFKFSDNFRLTKICKDNKNNSHIPHIQYPSF